MRRYLDPESARAEHLARVVSRHRLRLSVLLLAHAELRASRDPVIPSSLPSTSSPDIRLAVEADLQESIDAVRLVAARDRAVTVVRRGQFSVYARDGVETKMRTSVVEKAREKTDLPEDEFRYIVWASLVRYRAMGLLNTNSAAVPNRLYRDLATAWTRGPVVEGFASLFNSSLPRYMGLFPDTEVAFGCEGNFFAIRPEELERGTLIICNPPYQVEILNAFVDKTLEILDSSHDVAFLLVIPAFEVADRERLNFHGRCREKYPVDYSTDVDTTRLKTSAYTRFCALYCKEDFPFWSMTDDRELGLTSAMVLVMEGGGSGEGSEVMRLVDELPAPTKRIQCTPGTKAARREVSLRDKKSDGAVSVRVVNPWD